MTTLCVLLILALIAAGVYAIYALGFKNGAQASNNCEDCAQWMERMSKVKPEEFK
jgi:hypothetical protein